MATFNRKEVVEAIRAAFRDVTLGDGVPLRESDVIDDYGSLEERAAARALDFQGPWWEVPREDLKEYSSVFIFMDAQGFRYYLPRYMTEALIETNGRLGTFAWMTLEILESAQQFGHLPDFDLAQKRAILCFVEALEHLEPGIATAPCFGRDYLDVWAYWAEQVQE
nr:DUF6714 family protein [Deinococcus peraridilitoris]